MGNLLSTKHTRLDITSDYTDEDLNETLPKLSDVNDLYIHISGKESNRKVDIIKKLHTHLAGERNLNLSMDLGWLKSSKGLVKCLEYMPTSTKSAEMRILLLYIPHRVPPFLYEDFCEVAEALVNCTCKDVSFTWTFEGYKYQDIEAISSGLSSRWPELKVTRYSGTVTNFLQMRLRDITTL